MADRPLAVDMVVNHNLGATPDRYRGLVPDRAVILAGSTFALLRPAFADARDALGERAGTVHRIHVFMSGADEHDVTARAAEAAAATGVPVDVIVGSAYPSLRRLRAWASTRPTVNVHVNTHDMPALMAAADLAVGAPGSSSWERCTLALPSILVILADNQVEVAALLNEAGAAITLGWHQDVATEQMRSAISELMADPERLRAMGRAAGAITDGRGTKRVADAIQSLLVARSDPRHT
jgi:spore coat polysaccharide biosynthesis predicted glycosyltransferase SpsG